MTETNDTAPAAPEATEGEGGTDTETVETVSIPKSEWDKSQRTIGSLKRQVKDLSQAKEPQETPQKTDKPDELTSVQKRLDRQTLKAAGITHEDDIDLARKTAEKWNMELEDVVEDEDFQAKLQKKRDARANADATSNVKGDGGKGPKAKSADFFISRGTPPTPEEIPDRKSRMVIVNKMREHASTGGGKFYNE